MKLDKFDLRILEALQRDGRTPATQLAAQVGLSCSPTWERLRKLEKAGLLRGYHADVAVELIAQVVTVIVPVTLESHRGDDFKRFERAVAEIPEIVECWAVGGGVDYVLRFVLRTINEYQQLMDRLLQGDLGIRMYWSHVVTKPVKPFAGVPIGRLVDGDNS